MKTIFLCCRVGYTFKFVTHFVDSEDGTKDVDQNSNEARNQVVMRKLYYKIEITEDPTYL